MMMITARQLSSLSRCCSRVFLSHHDMLIFSNRSAALSDVRNHSTSSSSETATNATRSTSIFPLSLTGLGLEPSFVQSHLTSIAQLPEIKSFLEKADSQQQACHHVQQEALERARDIFAHFQTGGNEHKAVLALLAEHQQRQGNYKAALETLQQLRDYCDNARLEIDVLLAQSKTHWLHGQFAQALEICDSLVQEPVLEDSLPLHYAAARNGQALARLLSAVTLDDAFTLRDPPRMTVKFLERQQQQHGNQQLALALVAAQLNLGAAEVIYAEIIRRVHHVDAPLDGAMRAWKKGLELLKARNLNSNAAFLLEARLQTSMALVLLSKSTAAVPGKTTTEETPSSPPRNAAMQEEDLSRASKLASNALKVYDNQDNHIKEGLGRTLSLVATCYHRAGQAVTAEGLFQSAISSFDSSSSSSLQQQKQQQQQQQQHVVIANPLAKLEKIGALQAYANLLRDWERREGDAKKYDSQAAEMNASLPSGWQGKSGIHSALWFWTPGTFL